MKKRQQPRQYRASFLLTGSLSTVSGVLGLVPYAPYASSLGFLQSTGIRERAPFFVGSLLFVFLGMVPDIKRLFFHYPTERRQHRTLRRLFTIIPFCTPKH